MKPPKFGALSLVPISCSIVLMLTSILMPSVLTLNHDQAVAVFVAGVVLSLTAALKTRRGASKPDSGPSFSALLPIASVATPVGPRTDSEVSGAPDPGAAGPEASSMPSDVPEDWDELLKRVLVKNLLSSEIGLEVSVDVPADLFGEKTTTKGTITFKTAAKALPAPQAPGGLVLRPVPLADPRK